MVIKVLRTRLEKLGCMRRVAGKEDCVSGKVVC